MEDATQVLSAIASVAAVVIAYISYRAYRFLLPEAQLKLQQDEIINEISSILIEFQHQNIEIARFISGRPLLDQTEIEEFTDYFFESRSRLAKALYKALDKAARLGLWKTLTGTHPREGYETKSVELYTYFRLNLAHVERLDPSESSPDDYVKMHLIMGTVRLANQCRDYLDKRSGHSESLTLKNELERVFESMLHDDMIEDAWCYRD